MKLKISSKEIADISESLQMGMRAFYNTENKEILNLPKDFDYVDIDSWAETIIEIDRIWDVLLEFEPLPTHKSFEVMEGYTEQMPDLRFKKQLINALNRNKPFRNFKNLIEDSEYRLNWYEFKNLKYKEWINEQIDEYNKGYNPLSPLPIPIDLLEELEMNEEVKEVEDAEDENEKEDLQSLVNEIGLVNAAATLAQSFHSSDTTGHDWWHVWRVWNMAKHIAEQEKAELLPVELAALLHDMDDHKMEGSDWQNFPNAKGALQKLKVDSVLTARVIEIIGSVSFKGANVDTTPASLEACIVQDADRLDALGAIGIARAFAYGGSKNRPLFDPTIESVFHGSFEEYKN
jgi:uncharacterized protein